MTETCPTCGHSLSPSKYRLNSGHVSALFKLREAVRYYNRNSIHLRHDMGPGAPFQLSIDELTNFSFLRIYGLAVHDEKKTGHWVLTSRGNDFLNGRIVVPAVTYARNGHPTGEHSREVRHVDEFRTKIPKEFYERERQVEPPQTAPLFA